MELKDYKLFCVFIVALKIIKKKEHLLFQEHEPQYRYISKGKIQPHAPYISQFQTNNNFILVFYNRNVS